MFASGALAQNCTVPNNLTNGTNADATQVMANFNALLACVNSPNNQNVVRGYLSGLTLSTPGSSSAFAVAQGVATSSDNTTSMQLSGASSKTSASWVVGSGNGALDSGSIANNTWYHVYLINRPDTGVVDVCISASATGPNLTTGNIPAAYTLFRRIGSMKTNGSAQWTSFSQLGDEFLWAVAVQDSSTSGAVLYGPTLSVPRGIVVWALHNLLLINTTTADSGIVFSPGAENDPGTVNGFQRAVTGQLAAVSINAGWMQTRTDTSATIRIRVGLSTTTVIVGTRGWIDRRGRDN